MRTCLAAHELPAEYRDDRAGYVDLVVGEIQPHGQGGHVDCFGVGGNEQYAHTALPFTLPYQTARWTGKRGMAAGPPCPLPSRVPPEGFQCPLRSAR